MIASSLNLSGLSFERLMTLCRVAESGSIKDAADEDPTRQSQYSRQIKELETALGVVLFKRNGRRWFLTEEGQRLTLIARSFFQSLGAIQDLKRQTIANMRIGAGDGILTWYVIPRLQSLRTSMPDMSWSFKNLRTKDINRLLIEGEIDIGILREDGVHESLDTFPFLDIDYSIFVPRELLPEKSNAGFHYLKDLPMAQLLDDGLFFRSVNSVLNSQGIRIRVVFRAGSLVILAHAMRAMNLAGVIPQAASDMFPTDVFAKIEIEALSSIRRRYVLAINPDTIQFNPLIERVVRNLQS